MPVYDGDLKRRRAQTVQPRCASWADAEERAGGAYRVSWRLVPCTTSADGACA